MLNDLLDRIKLPFRKEKELYSSLFSIIGFYPRNIELYKLALLHKSVARRNERGKSLNNERLEFLGDAILDAIVGDIVYRHFPGKREGFLTNTRSKLVQRDTLNKLADEMGITRLVRSSGKGGAHNSYLGGNAFEALVGAIYLDRGYKACMKFMKKRILAQMINIDKMAYKEMNFKSKLIEWCQKNKVKLEFKLKREENEPNGSPQFEYCVILEGVEGCAGKGYSKKESQQKASKLTLEKLKKEPLFLDEVFAAKTKRTQMEEVPVQAVPSLPGSTDFMMEKKEADKPDTTAKENAEAEPKNNREQRKGTRRKAVEIVTEPELTTGDKFADEFDLSDISATPKEKTREEIVKEAEEAAFSAMAEEA